MKFEGYIAVIDTLQHDRLSGCYTDGSEGTIARQGEQAKVLMATHGRFKGGNESDGSKGEIASMGDTVEAHYCISPTSSTRFGVVKVKLFSAESALPRVIGAETMAAIIGTGVAAMVDNIQSFFMGDSGGGTLRSKERSIGLLRRGTKESVHWGLLLSSLGQWQAQTYQDEVK
ncbi:hypothetical protein PIB30_046168 [Stylosanthes scabra]|uniref:Uncharacterized protein n=1 Tax=Stylosanthes scabra TaxID=79078 RepID=A0ABU6VET7_9FABA|nr:hypothetical protein [Stylosanthes scabra]